MLLAPPPIDLGPPAVTDRNQGHWLDEGWALLLSVARPLRLADALRQRRLVPEQGRRLLHAVVGRVRPILVTVTEALIAGKVRLDGWWASFRDALIPGHFAGAMALLDSPEPAPADLQAIRDEANRQAGFLARFREQIRTGRQILDGTARARSDLYGEAVWSVGMNVERGKKIRDQYKFERSHLGVADHCTGCLEETSRGWVQIGSLMPIGQRICGPRCHCFITYK